MSDSAWPRFGAFSYGFDDLAYLISRFSEFGLTAVQWGSELLAESLANPDQIPTTRGLLEDADIEVIGLAGYRNLIPKNDLVRRENLEFLKRCLEIAPALGIPVVATETGTRNEEGWKSSSENQRPEALDALYASLEELLPVAEQYGSVIALEAYVNNVIRTEADVAQVLERFPSPSLQLVLDPFNYISADLLPVSEKVSGRLLSRFKDRFIISHLKDVGPEGAEIDTPAFGDGVFPMNHYIRFLRDGRPDLAIVLEHIDFDRIHAAIERCRSIQQRL